MTGGPVIKVLIVDDIASTRENLQKLLAFEDDIEVIGMASDGREGIEAARTLSPHVVLMDVNMPGMDGIQATEALALEAPHCPVVIMSVQGERDYLRRAMQSGAREFLVKPFSGDELIASIRRVHDLELKKGTYVRVVSGADGNGGGPAGPARRTVAAVHAIMAGKGGVGKSLLAVNLAAALRQHTGLRVCLVDLDLQFGDVGVLLNLQHTKTIAELVENVGALDPEFVDAVLADGPEGLRVLQAPFSPELGDLVRADHVRAILDILRREFDHIVVDTATQLSEATLEVVDMADTVVVVGALTIPAIKDTKLLLKMLESLRVEQERIVVVVNRHDAHADYNRARVEEHLRLPVLLEVPSDPRGIGASIHRALPIVLSNPEAEFSRRVGELVQRIEPGTAGAAAVVDTKRAAASGRRFGFRREGR